MAEQEQNDLMDDLEASFEEHENESEGTLAEDQGTEAASSAAEDSGEDGSGESGGDGPERDDHGRFAKKAGEETGDAPVAEGDTVLPGDSGSGADTPDPAEQVADEIKPPASWSPLAREGWAGIPKEIQSEIQKREHEMNLGMQESADARRAMHGVAQLEQKFGAALSAEGVDIGTATHNMLQFSSQLRFGTPQEKAQLVTQLINTYGVDIQALDAALSGQPAPQGQPQQQQAPPTDPRVDMIFKRLEENQYQSQLQTNNEVEQFINSKEFGADVRLDMADILTLASQRGLNMPLEEAYSRACALHPDISKVVAQRTGAKNANSASTSAARNAASSVRSSPASAPASGSSTGSIRDSLLNAMDEQEM